MKGSERGLWALSLLIVSVMYFLHSRSKVLESTAVLDDETMDDLSEDGSLGKTDGSLVLYNSLPDDDPLMAGSLKLKDFQFVHIPKTGGSFIERMFLDHLHIPVGKDVPNLYDHIQAQGDSERASTLRRHRCVYWHLPTSLISLHANETNREWGKKWLDKPKFAVVRHPVTRLLSEYNYIIPHKWGMNIVNRFVNIKVDVWKNTCDPEVFNNFMYNILVYIFDKKHMYYRDCHFVPQVRHITDAAGNQHVRYIMKQEDLTEEIQTFLGHLGGSITEEQVKKFGGNHRKPPCKVQLSDINRKTMKKIIEVYKEDFEKLDYEIPILPP
eukprot:TRINITY_DN9108_c0_g2_i1.p1 TRINITY_DN9108_c0_g2~~TRINITY_DN9108_c0_g2_i1.p1  ORF type:complete len:345 (+),score=43.38 TRINITY_DN9108_c0_g2_i1:59-1036(+)